MPLNILSQPVSVYALGGLGEVGKNMYVIESDEDIVIIDAGVKFPEESLVGVDYVIPDYTQLRQNQSKIKALIITHGHEDHIGGIPFLVQTINIPTIYAPRLAAGLIRDKLVDHRVKDNIRISEYTEDDVLTCGEMKVSFFAVTHSIPDSFGVVVDTPSGRIVDTGDFKIDLTPVGADINLRKIAQIGSEGVDLLLADSTNAAQEGYTPSEKNVYSSLNEIFSKTNNRIIVSTFSSNVSRIQQITDCAVAHNRKIATIGRSIENIIDFSRKYGYIHLEDDDLVDAEDIPNIPDDKIVILCTGSQGEPMAALSRIAKGEHKSLKIKPGDVVVFSSNPIPGNQLGIDRVINQLTKIGANVITNSLFSDIHSSGHPRKQELRLMLKLLEPTYFMPAHGEYYMLKSHKAVAIQLGIEPDHVFICENGDSLILNDHVVRQGPKVQAGDVFIDGNNINGVNSAIITDRKILKEDGMVEIMVCIDPSNNKIIGTPKIKTLGFVTEGDYKDHLVRHTAQKVTEALNVIMSTNKVTFNLIKSEIKTAASKYLFRKTQRNPMIIPVIMSVQK